jgi:CBS domain-containing protein
MSSLRATKQLTVRDIMSRNVVTVEPEDTLREVIETLAAQKVSGAPVMSGAAIVGVISRTDILDFLAATPAVPTTTPQFAEWGELEAEDENEPDEQSSSFYTDLWEDAGADVVERFAETTGPEWDLLSEHTASGVMTRKLETVTATATVVEAARRLLDRGVHRLLVVSAMGELLGVVSMTDLVRLIARRSRASAA